MTVKTNTVTKLLKDVFPIRQLDSLCMKIPSITLKFVYGQIFSKTAICIPANKSIQMGKEKNVNLLHHFSKKNDFEHIIKIH